MEAIRPEVANVVKESPRAQWYKKWQLDDPAPVAEPAQGVSAARKPVTLGTIVGGVFLGNLLSAIVIGIVYAILTAGK